MKTDDRFVIYSGDILKVKKAFGEYLNILLKLYNFEELRKYTVRFFIIN
ncbi:hypothetical protein [Acetivibrio saccincola]|nr:hypothetical protein [Acetivibrio saccincola]